MAIWPFIILRRRQMKSDVILMNHERIHLRQQIEMLIIPFFIWYGIEFLIRLMQNRNGFEAYRNISFEREAYQNEANLQYIKQRSFWKFLDHL